MIRNKFLDEVRKGYVLLARSKGLSKKDPVEALSSKCIADDREYHGSFGTHVTGGTVTVEAVFNYVGIGNLAVEICKISRL